MGIGSLQTNCEGTVTSSSAVAARTVDGVFYGKVMKVGRC